LCPIDLRRSTGERGVLGGTKEMWERRVWEMQERRVWEGEKNECHTLKFPFSGCEYRE
jgi:hypothetical protein